MTARPAGRNTGPASRAGAVFLAFAAMGAFVVVAEHRAHVLPYLPWLILLACPLLHLVMHGRHGAHRPTDADADSPAATPPREAPPAGRDGSKV